MANRTSLCTSVERLIYPSSSEEGYNWKQHTIAADAEAIPLMWLMLFRETDISEQEVRLDQDTTTPLSAPIVAIDTALARLPQSLAAFSFAFPQQRALQPHAEMMASVLSSPGRQFVTIELSELEDGLGAESFWPMFRHCLRGFEDPACSIPTPSFARGAFPPSKQWLWPDSLFEFTSLRFNVILPPADLLHSGWDHPEDDLWNQARLFGEAVHRPVPWEPAET